MESSNQILNYGNVFVVLNRNAGEADLKLYIAYKPIVILKINCSQSTLLKKIQAKIQSNNNNISNKDLFSSLFYV